jgi:hypothetical protein
VTAVRCAMVDVRFEGGTLTAIEQALIIGADGALPLIAEVQSRRGARHSGRRIAVRNKSGRTVARWCVRKAPP